MLTEMVRAVRQFLGIRSPKDVARTQMIEAMPRDAICAEIGVWEGKFARRVLDLNPPRRYHLIDPWLFQSEYPKRWYGGKRAQSQEDMDRIYERIVNELGSRENVVVHRGFSEKVVEEFENEYFDWVYVDGNHSYDFVKRDFELYWEKLKPGGFMAGDDYRWGGGEGLHNIGQMFANVFVYDYVVLARTKLTKRNQTRGKFRRNFPSTHKLNNELYTLLPNVFFFQFSAYHSKNQQSWN